MLSSSRPVPTPDVAVAAAQQADVVATDINEQVPKLPDKSGTLVATEPQKENHTKNKNTNTNTTNASPLLLLTPEGFESPTKTCLARIHADLLQLHRDPLMGITVARDETRINRLHAILVGPSDTPYEYGFFGFQLDLPNHYPHVPPKVTFQTTGGGSVRFHPSLYKDGTVCLSILGTWNGPGWTPVQTIGSLLLSIQSLLNATPYHSEPGFETVEKEGKPPLQYNQVIRHETLRVAVLDMVDWVFGDNCQTHFPAPLPRVVLDAFLQQCDMLSYVAEEYCFLDGRSFCDPYGWNKGVFDFGRLQMRLQQMAHHVLSTLFTADASWQHETNQKIMSLGSAIGSTNKV